MRLLRGGAGPLTTEEHVIPEAFGNDNAVLPRGLVCDPCNNLCSKLDQYLIDFEPISFQRVLNVPYTKNGKLPRAEFANLTVEKRMPRVIRLIHKKEDRDSFQIYDRQADGTVRFNINFQGRKPLDVQLLGRALFKIALGMIAFQGGVDRACNTRYDAARAFIAGSSDFDNVLLLGSLPDVHSGIEFRWLESEEGTPFGANFYGVGFMSNLELIPRVGLNPDDELSKRFTAFSLKNDTEEP